MRAFPVCLLGVALAAMGCAHTTAAPGERPPALEGAFQGTLNIGAVHLRLVLHIDRQPVGWSATFDSIDQNARGIPIDGVIVTGRRVWLASSRIKASFDAVLDGDRLTGTFRQRGLELPLALTRTAAPLAVVAQPQTPTRPFPYDELMLAIDNPAGHDTLGCTLTKPRAAGPFPAVVMITGSGPQDRDETIMGHKPFLVLADALTRRGIAVLRCDDRGVGASTGDYAAATTFDFVSDALAAVAALRTRPDIAPGAVGLVGHSEGAIVAPMAAAASKDVRFVVLLAAPAVPGDETLYLQGAAIARAAGASEAQIAAETAFKREVFGIVKAAKDGPAAAEELRRRYAALPEAERRALEPRPGTVEAQIGQVTSPWLKTFLSLDPRVYLRQLAVPALAIQGLRDIQVVPDPNLAELRQALAGKPDVTIRPLPGLNHLLQSCHACTVDEYSHLEETMSPAVPSLVADWIMQHAGAP